MVRCVLLQTLYRKSLCQECIVISWLHVRDFNTWAGSKQALKWDHLRACYLQTSAVANVRAIYFFWGFFVLFFLTCFFRSQGNVKWLCPIEKIQLCMKISCPFVWLCWAQGRDLCYLRPLLPSIFQWCLRRKWTYTCLSAHQYVDLKEK